MATYVWVGNGLGPSGVDLASNLLVEGSRGTVRCDPMLGRSFDGSVPIWSYYSAGERAAQVTAGRWFGAQYSVVSAVDRLETATLSDYIGRESFDGVE
jgi:hypothetical protein